MVSLKFFLLQWVEYQTYSYSDHRESEYWEKKIQETIPLSSLEIFTSHGNKYQRRQWVQYFSDREIFFCKNLFRARTFGPGTSTEVSAHCYHASLWDYWVGSDNDNLTPPLSPLSNQNIFTGLVERKSRESIGALKTSVHPDLWPRRIFMPSIQNFSPPEVY